MLKLRNEPSNLSNTHLSAWNFSKNENERELLCSLVGQLLNGEFNATEKHKTKRPGTTRNTCDGRWKGPTHHRPPWRPIVAGTMPWRP